MIYLKSPTEIEHISYINKLGAELLQLCYDKIKIGLVTKELEHIVNSHCIRYNVKSSFKGYKGFPHNVCVSINDEVIHGFPSERVVVDGDIVSVDVGLQKDNYYSDAAFTKVVGHATKTTKELVRITNECLHKGIEQAVPGNRIYDISDAIQQHAESMGFNVIRDYVGHGVGLALHEDPKIPNYRARGINWLLRPGMVIAIEPLVVEGLYEVYVDENNWTIITKDHSLSAHFEHSVAITAAGPKILSEL